MLAFLVAIWNQLFGCQHDRITFPLTPKRRSGGVPVAASRFGTYVVCLSCGKELAYDWDEMRVVGPRPSRGAAVEAQPSYR